MYVGLSPRYITEEILALDDSPLWKIENHKSGSSWTVALCHRHFVHNPQNGSFFSFEDLNVVLDRAVTVGSVELVENRQTA
jgi:hypothetical protein